MSNNTLPTRQISIISLVLAALALLLVIIWRGRRS